MDILKLVEIILSAIFGTGGLCAFIITIVKLNKKSKTYEVRCRLAAEFLKRDIVKMTPEGSKQLFIDILEGRVDETNDRKEKLANKIIKEAQKEQKHKKEK